MEDYLRWSIPSKRVVSLVIDETYWSNKICLFIYRENELKDTLLYRTTTGEYAEETTEELINIMSAEIIIESITCNSHKSALKAVKETNKYIKNTIKQILQKLTKLSFKDVWCIYISETPAKYV